MESGLCDDFFAFVEEQNEDRLRVLNRSQAEDLSSLASMAIQDDIDVIYQFKGDKQRLVGLCQGNYLEVKLMNLFYSDIRTVNNALKGIPEFKVNELICRKFHFTLVQETWLMASCVGFDNKVSLSCILKQLKVFSPGSKVPIESVLILIVKATELANEIFSKMKVVGSFYPDNIYFLKKPSGVEVYFEVFTIDFLQKRLKLLNLYPEKYGFSIKAFFWSLGVIIYSCLSGLEASELPSFASLSSTEIESLIDRLEFIPALTSMLKSFFDGSINDFDSVLKSNTFQTWSFIISNSKKQPEHLCPHGFYTSFYFTNKPLIYQNLPFLCISNNFVKEMSSELYIKHMIYAKVIEHLTFFPDLNEGMLEFSLHFLIKLKEISPVSIRKLSLHLIFRITKLKINLDDAAIRTLLIRVLRSLIKESTLTVQMIFQNAGIMYCLYDNFSADSKDLFAFLSYLGTKSIEHIKFFRNSKKYTEANNSIIYMQQIPVHFKLQVTYDILQEMDDLMKTWAPTLIFDNKKIHSMYLAVTILFELLQAGKEAKICNQLGKCYKNSLSFNVSPVMVNCISCNKQVCLSCAQHHIELIHKISFLTHYKISNFTCNEDSPKLYMVHPSRTVLPTCEEMNLDHFTVENSVYTWKLKYLELPSTPSTEVIFYVEVFFAKCESENITLQIKGAKIEYDNTIPAIVKNHAFYCNSPRIGATDTVGIGVTGDSKVFFTYNGFNLGRYIEFSSSFIEIEIKIESFTQPILNGNCPCLYNMQAYNFLDKERLNEYKCISNIFVVLVLLKKKIMKKCMSWSINLYSVVDELKNILDFNSLKQKLKKDSSPHTPGQGFRTSSFEGSKETGKALNTIGNYSLGKTIGEGTFGKVKLGIHVQTQEKVAIKILEKDRICDVSDIERVSRELHILKLIRHPDIIQLYEVSFRQIIETPRKLYLIMEYASGGELFEYIVKEKKIREKEACKFFQQLVAGVEYISKLNVVHRDLKPENLLLDHKMNIKIVDFGLSNTYKSGEMLKTACGSPCYAAPEMIAGKKYQGLKADLWSCGVILFAMICGYLPFEDSNTNTLYKKILAGDYVFPKFISADAKDMIKGVLNTNPENRFGIQEIRNHPWFSIIKEVIQPGILIGYDHIIVDLEILKQLKRYGYNLDYTKKCLEASKHNDVTTAYYLLLKKYIQSGGTSIADYGYKPDPLHQVSLSPQVTNTPIIPVRRKILKASRRTGSVVSTYKDSDFSFRLTQNLKSHRNTSQRTPKHRGSSESPQNKSRKETISGYRLLVKKSSTPRPHKFRAINK